MDAADESVGAPAPEPSNDWAVQATDAVEKVVATVRDRTVVPAQKATRAIVFGFVATFFVVPAVVLTLVATFRLVDRYLPGDTWATWLLFGGIFLVAGSFVWVRKQD